MFQLNRCLSVPAEIRFKTEFARHVRSKLESGEWKRPPEFGMNFSRYPDDDYMMRQEWEILE